MGDQSSLSSLLSPILFILRRPTYDVLQIEKQGRWPISNVCLSLLPHHNHGCIHPNNSDSHSHALNTDQLANDSNICLYCDLRRCGLTNNASQLILQGSQAIKTIVDHLMRRCHAEPSQHPLHGLTLQLDKLPDPCNFTHNLLPSYKTYSPGLTHPDDYILSYILYHIK